MTRGVFARTRGEARRLTTGLLVGPRHITRVAARLLTPRRGRPILMLVAGVAGLCGVLLSVSPWDTIVLAQAGASDQRKLRMQSLAVSDNLYLLSGGGNNALVMTADTGVALVDLQPAGWGKAIVNAYSPITDQQLTTVILTGASVEVVGALLEMPRAAKVVAHERTKARLAQLDIFKGAGASALPNETLTDTWSAFDGQDKIEVFHAGAGRTDGDLVVVFPGKRTAFLGDLFPDKSTPVIEPDRGGSGVAFPETLTRIVEKLSGITRIVPGRVAAPAGSPVGRWMTMADLQEYAEFNRAFLEAVRAAKAAGKTADEAAASLALPERFKAYGMANARANVAAIYGETK